MTFELQDNYIILQNCAKKAVNLSIDLSASSDALTLLGLWQISQAQSPYAAVVAVAKPYLSCVLCCHAQGMGQYA